MIPQPFVADRVSQVVGYLQSRVELSYGQGEFGNHFDADFDTSGLLNQPIAGTSLRGWNGGPFILIHRTGGQILAGGMLEAVDLQLDAYGPTADDADDAAVFARESLAVAATHLDQCVAAAEIVGPMLLPDLQGSLDAYRYLLQWRLRFRL